MRLVQSFRYTASTIRIRRSTDARNQRRVQAGDGRGEAAARVRAIENDDEKIFARGGNQADL